ncbi:MAG: hypothetical protein AB1728_12400 [Bacteroidota bacterium]
MRKVLMIATAVAALALTGFASQSTPAADDCCGGCCTVQTCCK